MIEDTPDPARGENAWPFDREARASDLAARVYQLERAAEIAAFHRRERQREWRVGLMLLQIGLACSALLYLAGALGWLPDTWLVPGGSFGHVVAGVIAALFVANIVLDSLSLRREGDAQRPELALAEAAE
jgi:hypothetical protein